MRRLKSLTISLIRRRFLTKIDTGEIKHPSALVDAMEKVKRALYVHVGLRDDQIPLRWSLDSRSIPSLKLENPQRGN